MDFFTADQHFGHAYNTKNGTGGEVGLKNYVEGFFGGTRR